MEKLSEKTLRAIVNKYEIEVWEIMTKAKLIEALEKQSQKSLNTILKEEDIDPRVSFSGNAAVGMIKL